MDADLTQALGSNATVSEKLYAEAIEDTRANQAKLEAWRAASIQMFEWFKTEYNKLPPEQAPAFDDKDALYERCVFLGIECRKQAMNTTTTRTLMDDVIADGFYIGEQVYARILQHKVGTA